MTEMAPSWHQRIQRDLRAGRSTADILDHYFPETSNLLEEEVTETGLQLPHPRLSERAFVLFPLADIAPDWRHPSTGQTVMALINGLEPGQEIEKMD